MQIEIYDRDGKYHWSIYDGPDGIDFLSGICDSLGRTFEEIVKAKLLIAQQY